MSWQRTLLAHSSPGLQFLSLTGTSIPLCIIWQVIPYQQHPGLLLLCWTPSGHCLAAQHPQHQCLFPQRGQQALLRARHWLREKKIVINVSYQGSLSETQHPPPQRVSKPTRSPVQIDSRSASYFYHYKRFNFLNIILYIFNSIYYFSTEKFTKTVCTAFLEHSPCWRSEQGVQYGQHANGGGERRSPFSLSER